MIALIFISFIFLLFIAAIIVPYVILTSVPSWHHYWIAVAGGVALAVLLGIYSGYGRPSDDVTRSLLILLIIGVGSGAVAGAVEQSEGLTLGQNALGLALAFLAALFAVHMNWVHVELL